MKRKAMETENKPVFILLARRFRPLTENSPAQRDSIMSNGRLSVASCWPHGQSSPAQRDSGIYKLGAGRAGLTSLTSLTEPQCASAQRDSEMSILAELLKTAPAQRDSIMSALGMGLIGPMGPMGPIGLMGQKPGIKNAPAQWDSEISILGMGLIGPMGPIGLMGNKPGMKNAPAQRDSGNSIFGSMGQQPIKNSPAQRDSKMILIKEAREG